MSCPRSLPCNMQSDNDVVRFTVVMDNTSLNYSPTFKMAHYRYFRVKWLSFQCPLAGQDVLHLGVNSLGEGKQDITYTSTNRYASANVYTISMPLQEGERVALDSSADPWSWIPLPEGVNLKNIQFYAWTNGIF